MSLETPSESNKILNEFPISHAIPFFPVISNSFSVPNDLSIYSSKDNLLSNPKSSSYMMSVKSKSRKSLKSSKDNNYNNNNKSSIVSSLNILPCCKSKSSSFSRKIPNINPVILKSIQSQPKSAQRTYESLHRSHENLVPSIYFSLSHLPSNDHDSPLLSPGRTVLSLNSINKKHRNTKTIKRNLLIYSTSKDKKKSFFSKQSQILSLIEMKSQKLFTNQHNLILKDLVFFEEGLEKQKFKKPKRKFAIKKCKDSVFKQIIYPLMAFFKAKAHKISMIQFWKRPFCESSMVWDLVILCLLVFYYIWLPIELAFKITDSPIYLFATTGFFLLADSLKKVINHSSEKKNTHSNNPNQDFILDVISIFFLGIFLFDIWSVLRPLWGLGFIILKVQEVQRNILKVQIQIKMKKRLSFILAVSILLIRTFCFANLTGCLWIYIGLNCPDQTSSWISNFVTSYSNLSLYFRSLTVNLTNITFVGLGMTQGLIVPANSIEYFYNCLVTFSGFLFVWYNLRSCQQLFTKEDEEEKVNLAEFERILKNYGLDYDERIGFTKELGLVLSKNREQKMFGELLKMMSPSFQETLLMRIYWPIIKKMPVLAKNFSKAFLVKLLHKIRIISITPNETLFKEGDYGNECLYYVINGEIECYVKLSAEEKNNLKLRTVQSNEYFREFSFFSHRAERFSAKSLTFSSILKIELHDFLDVLKEFPLDHENYISIKEKINTYNNITPLFLICSGCHQKNHQIFECPTLIYNPKKAYIFEDFFSSLNHIDRRIFQRKTRNTQNALFNLKEIESQLIDFNDKYQDEINRVLDEIYPSSDNEYSDSNPINETEGKGGTNDYRSMESKDSKYTNDQVNMKNKEEEFLGNPPSIFLQSPTKKSRKSMTESIFHEAEEQAREDEEDDDTNNNNNLSNNYTNNKRKESKTEKTLNGLELENEAEDFEEYEEIESEKKGTSKHFTATNEESVAQSINQMNTVGQSISQKGLRSYQKFFSERESKIVSEKDTFHVLQNFEKMSKVANNNNNTHHTSTAQQTGGGSMNKKSYIGSYSNSKSISSTYKKPAGYLVKSNSSSHSNNNGGYISTRNKKTKHSDYLSQPLFAFDFDKPKEFRAFLPHNNLGKVIKKVEIDVLLRSVRLGRVRVPTEETEGKKKSMRVSNLANTSLSTKKKDLKESLETN